MKFQEQRTRWEIKGSENAHHSQIKHFDVRVQVALAHATAEAARDEQISLEVHVIHTRTVGFETVLDTIRSGNTYQLLYLVRKNNSHSPRISQCYFAVSGAATQQPPLLDSCHSC